MAGNVELEQPEDRPHCDPLQTIGAPREPGMRLAISRSTNATPSVTMMRVRSEPRSTRKLVTKPSTTAAKPATIRPTTVRRSSMLGEKTGHVGAKTEIRRMAERNDAGVSEDQIEREREQREDGNFRQDQMPVRHKKYSTPTQRARRANSSGRQRARSASC